MIPNVLSIAGIDPSGGAGLLADLKTFSALGAYGTGVVAALTAQNTQGVTGLHPVPAGFIAQQIDTLFTDVRIDAVKLGMLGQAEVVTTVAAALRRHEVCRLVLDPVMISTSGHRLLTPEAIEALRRELVPEAEALLNCPPLRTLADMRVAARALHQLGPRLVVLKGGHLDGAESVDVIDDGHSQVELTAPRIVTKNTHGTGCTLSAAIAALLPRHDSPLDAIRAAKAYLTAALAAADQLEVGKGHGPVHHFHTLWR
jgi:hydroxymethylpyrimidine/phosphomethylpyrimidine kinase